MSAIIAAFRPTELRFGRYRVDLHEFDHVGHVILWQGRTIAVQRNFDTLDAAVIYARGLADEHDCPLIRQNHRTVEI